MKGTDQTTADNKILIAVQALAKGQKKLVKVIGQDRHDATQNIQDLMMMTSEGLDRLDRNMTVTNERLDSIEGEIRDLRNVSHRHELKLGELGALVKDRYDEQLNIHSDINEILHKILALTGRTKKTRADVRMLQNRQQKIIDWAKLVAKKESISLKLG